MGCDAAVTIVTLPRAAKSPRSQRTKAAVSAATRLALYAQLARLDKPIGTMLLLWPTLTALWIATAGAPPPLLVAVFGLGTWLMRSAGCAINDVLDRDFDGGVKRTAARVIPTGQVRPAEGVAVAAVLAALAGLLLLPLNRVTFFYALVALAVAVSYPLFKRFFPLPQAWLGIAFSFGIPMAFAAAQGTVPALGWALFAGNLFWVVAYDTQYAMVDRDDDLRMGAKSTAILFGELDLPAQGVLYAGMFAALALVGRQAGLGPWYWAGLAVALLLVVWEFRLARTRAREDCFRAFLHNNWVGLAVFAGIALDFALRAKVAAA